jgi:catechol-2,3-dioxygenase
MLATADMEETILFYQSVLGFAPTLKSQDYSILERDGQTIHIQKAASEEVMKCVRGTPRYTLKFPRFMFCGNMWRRLRTATEFGIYLTGNMV